MRGDIGDALAVEIDLAAVAKAFHILRAGERAASVGDEIFRTHGSDSPSLDSSRLDCTSETPLYAGLAPRDYQIISVSPETEGTS